MTAPAEIRSAKTGAEPADGICAVFLDRDGILNVDKGYVHTREEWEWLPGARDALNLFRQAGWLVVVASNQSGIGRGMFTRTQVNRLHEWVNSQLPLNTISGWYVCPHRPDEGCFCRKPLPGLLLQAAADHHIDLGRSWMFGDKISDVEAGLNAGTRAGLIGRESGSPTIVSWPSLFAAAEWLTCRDRSAVLKP